MTDERTLRAAAAAEACGADWAILTAPDSVYYAAQVDTVIETGISAFAGGPQKLAQDPAVAEVAGKHDATPSQVALAWLLARYDRILLIPGTTSVAHLEENLAAGDVALDADDLATLDSVQQAGRPQR